MSLGGIAIAIGATVDAEIVMIEAAHKKLEHAPPGRRPPPAAGRGGREVTPAIFFSLLIIAVAFLPVFTLTGQAGRLFKPLAYTKTFVMLISALLSITFAPALRDLLIRGKIRPEHRTPGLALHHPPLRAVRVRGAAQPEVDGRHRPVRGARRRSRSPTQLGHEFMPPLNEGDLLYMPITFPNISIEEAKRQLQIQDRILRGFPEVETVFGKVGRAETADRSGAAHHGRDHGAAEAARTQWRKRHHDRWYSRWAPGWLKPALRPLWPEQQPLTWDELTAEMNAQDAVPRLDQRLDHADQDPHRHADAPACARRSASRCSAPTCDEIEQVGIALEHLLAPIPGTRSVLYERNLGGLYVDIVPRPDALARYGLRVGDVAARHRERHRRHADRHHHRGAQPLHASTCATRRTCAATSSRCAGAGPAARRRRARRRADAAPERLGVASAAGRWPRRDRPGAGDAGMGGAAGPRGSSRMPRPRLPGDARSTSDMPPSGRMGGAMPRCRRSALRCGSAPQPTGRRRFRPPGVRPARPAGRHPHRRRPAHGARRGRPAGRLRLRRHRPGQARHRRLRRRGQGRWSPPRWRAASSPCPPGIYLKWTGQYEQLAADGRRA